MHKPTQTVMQPSSQETVFTNLKKGKAPRSISSLLCQHLHVIMPSQTGIITLLSYFVGNNWLTWQKSFLMSIYKLLLTVH